MNLTEFQQECYGDVARFSSMWWAGHNKDAALYPLDLPPGEWFDQFLSFITSEENK